jgi:hypothetical protein
MVGMLRIEWQVGGLEGMNIGKSPNSQRESNLSVIDACIEPMPWVELTRVAPAPISLDPF